MSVFLIDYENLHASAFSGLEELSEEDRVLIFYTNNSDNLTFSLMERLVRAKAKIQYMKVICGGKNSLDFQLCSYLGYLIGTSSDTRFCIVSRDKGYNTMLSLWGDKTENGNTVVCGVTIRNGMNKSVIADEAADVETAAEASAEEQEQTQLRAEQPELIQPEQAEPTPEQTEQAAAEAQPQRQPEEQAAEAQNGDAQPEQQPEKPKRKYNRRAPYKRKPKAPAEQSA